MWAASTLNGLLDRRPVLAVSCRTVDDVRRAVESADRLGLPVSVRGGGHSVAGHGVGADSLLVDLSPMRDVAVDPVARRVRVAGGAVWNDVDPATQRHGLAVPGGTFGDTGVGGLTLGGEIGWLIGTGGLTCDNLVSAELVTPTGEVVVAGEGGDPELLWALRGGGGNFGVVTSFELTMHECGPMLGGLVLFRVDDAPAVLTGVAELMREAPDELVIQPAVRVGVEHAQSGCAVMFAYAGPPEDGRLYVDAIRQLEVPLSESHGPMSYLQVQAMNELLPFGLRHYWSGHFVSDIHPETASAVCERLDKTPGSTSSCSSPLGSRTADRPGDSRLPGAGSAVERDRARGLERPSARRHRSGVGAQRRRFPSAVVVPRRRVPELRRTRRAGRSGADGIRRRPLGPAPRGQATLRPQQHPAL